MNQHFLYQKLAAHLLALLPFVWLIYAGFNGQLGADPQEKVLHEFGLWGLIFLLLSLSMTPLRKYLSIAPWIKFRRMLGLYSTFYICLHFIAYLLFYLSFDFSELLSEIIERPYITVGFIALLGLIPLTITSTKAAQKKLGKKWKRLHQFVYIIAALGLVHFIWQSKSDLNEPLLYVAWAVILVIARIK